MQCTSALSSRFVRSLRVLDSQAGEVALLRRGLTKLEAGNRGIDGVAYGDSRRLLSGFGMTRESFEGPRCQSPRLDGGLNRARGVRRFIILKVISRRCPQSRLPCVRLFVLGLIAVMVVIYNVEVDLRSRG